uniref:Uncharacterized protein n=1 Tax=Heterorhabditis bacteriophora TaxID=37862 RepID=A0A1I7WWJ0_HETBA
MDEFDNNFEKLSSSEKMVTTSGDRDGPVHKDYVPASKPILLAATHVDDSVVLLKYEVFLLKPVVITEQMIFKDLLVVDTIHFSGNKS